MIYLKAKAVKTRVSEAGKQINKGALEVLDRYVDKIIGNLISGQRGKRITEKTLTL
jgi:hypothetical protein